MGCTLGDTAGAGHSFSDGIGWTRFSCIARVNKAFLTGSPAARLGVVVEGGSVNIDIMSSAACRRKLSNLISGNGISFGKNVTVSQARGVFVLGK